MDFDQIAQQVEWLDEERRKDKNAVVALDDRIEQITATMQSMLQQNKELNNEISRLKSALSRVDSIDEGLLNQKRDTKQLVDNLEKEISRRSEESDKVRRVELGAIDANIAEIRKELSALPEYRRSLQTHAEEDIRLKKSIEELRTKIDEVRRQDDEYTRLYRLLEDGRRQDAKRLTDLQGEQVALRKRMDEIRSQYDMTGTSLKKLDAKLTEIESTEREKRTTQAKYIEEQSLIQVERDRLWKDWQSRFDVIEKQTVEIEATLQTLDATQRSVARAQQTVDELAQKVERRLTEMTEVQHLADERFRQEWVTFKADDQKRWTNYSLTQEEQQGMIVRQNEKLNDRLTALEDSMQEIQDLIQIMNELNGKRLQGMLANLHEWVDTYERSLRRTGT